MFYLRLLPCLLLPIGSIALAQGSADLVSVETRSQHRPETALISSTASLAEQWGLKEEEMFRFQALMRGPLGIYSPNLDPLSALGIEARTNAERQRYALLQVQAEATRVEKLLAYQRAYDDAWKERYPKLVLVNLPPMSSPLLNRSTVRPAVFVRYECPECESTVRQLQASGTMFDLYMVNSQQDDKRIRQWAQKVGILPSKVLDGTITINHDSGRWASIAANGVLPAVMHKVSGKWQRQ